MIPVYLSSNTIVLVDIRILEFLLMDLCPGTLYAKFFCLMHEHQRHFLGCFCDLNEQFYDAELTWFISKSPDLVEVSTTPRQ